MQLSTKDDINIEIPSFRSLSWLPCGMREPPCASDYISGL